MYQSDTTWRPEQAEGAIQRLSGSFVSGHFEILREFGLFQCPLSTLAYHRDIHLAAAAAAVQRRADDDPRRSSQQRRGIQVSLDVHR